MLLTVRGVREREPGLSGLWGLTVSSQGWTWTNTGDSSSVAGSTFTWRAQVVLWAARMYCSSSFSAFRATTSSKLRFLSSQLFTSTWRVSIWSSLFCLQRAAASLFLFLLIFLFSSSSGSRTSSSAFLLFALPGLAVFSVLTLYLTTLGTHSNSARMTSPLLPSGVTTVAEPPPHKL